MMTDQDFEKRLSQELTRWQEKGWVSEQGGQFILSDMRFRTSHTARPWLFPLVGALLLGLGVIVWFAAHWNEMSKLIKLTLIFIALAASQVGYGISITRSAQPNLAQAIALLSFLFFGAAILLVGQMYHVDAYFPHGIALWAAGGLLTAWLLGSQPIMVASIAVAGVWTWIEQLEYFSMNWLLLGYLALAVGIIFQRDWKIAARALGLLFLLWVMCWHAQPWVSEIEERATHVRLFALQILAIAGCWGLMQVSKSSLMKAVRIDFLSALLVGLFVFTFPELDFASSSFVRTGWALWLVALAASLAIYTLGIIRLIRGVFTSSEISLYTSCVFALGLASLLIMEVIVPPSRDIAALLWNGAFLGILYWVGDLGLRYGDRAMVNRVFIGFLIWVLARYFDTFWSLIDRSFFFMVGGVLLLVGGGWLERRRRRMLRHFESEGHL